jgi:hypothetical protein
MKKYIYDHAQSLSVKFIFLIVFISLVIPQVSHGANVLVSAGTNITVTPLTGVQFTFSDVVLGGVLSVTLTKNPAPPTDFRLSSVETYDTNFSGALGGPVTICINYSQYGLDGGNEPNLKLLQLENAAWKEITTSIDMTNDTICGVTSFLEGALYMTRPATIVGYSPLWHGMTLVSLTLAGGYMLRRTRP